MREAETISLKALVVYHTPATPDSPPNQVQLNETEGLELAKLGVKKDSESQLCWHVLGMCVHPGPSRKALPSSSLLDSQASSIQEGLHARVKVFCSGPQG